MSNYGAPYRFNDDTPPQKVNYSASAGVTATAFGSQTRVIRIVASTDCYVRLGTSTVSAQTSDTFVKANWTPELVEVTPGQYISAIQDTAAGILYVTEMTR